MKYYEMFNKWYDKLDESCRFAFVLGSVLLIAFVPVVGLPVAILTVASRILWRHRLML